MMRALARRKTQWKEDLFVAVKFAEQKLSKYNAEVTPTTGMFLISAQILDPFWKLRSFRKMDKGNRYQSWGWDILHCTIPRGLSEVCGE